MTPRPPPAPGMCVLTAKPGAAGDIGAMAEAALGLAATQTFGTFPGRVPAFLHEAYSLARGEQRVRLAVALARAWAYGYDPARAAGFAAEALAYAEAHDDPSSMACGRSASHRSRTQRRSTASDPVSGVSPTMNAANRGERPPLKAVCSSPTRL